MTSLGKKNLKISFYTTCMGRLKHVKRTLPKNIEENKDYDNCEFIILDYNSPDGLANWITGNLKKYLDSGRVKLYSTKEPLYFTHNHAKNMAAKQCTGDILCGIDADNFTALGPDDWGLAKRLNYLFHKHEKEKIFVRAYGWDDRELAWSSSSTYRYYSSSGKIAVRKKDFMEAGGYNENLKGHYFDEEELWKRIKECFGFRHIKLDASYSKAINHSNYERLKNLSPELVDFKALNDARIKNPSHVNSMYMKDGWVRKYYSHGLENQELMADIIKNKTKNPNGNSWGEGKVERIK
jgi:predicted glycosyltransferase involved in capsule biosynthesis